MYTHILVALDGSKSSEYAGQAAIVLAQSLNCRITACHVYGAEYHRQRFTDMEPGLPAQYQDNKSLAYLRSTHDKLIHEGFHSLSAGYMRDFIEACSERGIMVEPASAEGRSYVGILHLAAELKCDLIVIGADGLGATGNGLLGGTTTRILNSAMCDVLIARTSVKTGPIIVGVDGSRTALNAVDTAVHLSRAMECPVHLAAVYDPDFHTHVFGVMAQALSVETQQEIGLEGQEQLHDEIINDGLGKLYMEFLNQARAHVRGNGVALSQSLLTGKPYCALNDAAKKKHASLVVVSRHGHHRESYSRLGSNAEGLIRTTSSNVLLVGGVDEKLDKPRAAIKVEQLEQPADGPIWDANSQQRLKRVPSFVRTMAKNMVENAVKKAGRKTVTAADFDHVAEQFGMMPKRDTQ